MGVFPCRLKGLAGVEQGAPGPPGRRRALRLVAVALPFGFLGQAALSLGFFGLQLAGAIRSTRIVHGEIVGGALRHFRARREAPQQLVRRSDDRPAQRSFSVVGNDRPAVSQIQPYSRSESDLHGPGRLGRRRRRRRGGSNGSKRYPGRSDGDRRRAGRHRHTRDRGAGGRRWQRRRRARHLLLRERGRLGQRRLARLIGRGTL